MSAHQNQHSTKQQLTVNILKQTSMLINNTLLFKIKINFSFTYILNFLKRTSIYL